jgi:CheY-like chemotaxis protein
MPEMNGRQLAERLHPRYPNLKRLFMTGYAPDTIADRGVLGDGLHLVQKPFTVQVLAAKVRAVLEAPS